MRANRLGAIPTSLLACAAGAALAAALLALPGCNLFAFAAMSYDRATPRTVEAQYKGVADKDFAVVATTDRMIEADFPGVVLKVIDDVSRRLAAEKGVNAGGYIPPDRVMAYLYAHPNWVARPMSDLARELGVQRLIFIEITEYRLNEPGNSYNWQGVAAGVVQVYQTESQLPDDPAFDRTVQVTYPDGSNAGPDDMPGNAVGSMLVARFVDRVCWLFYRHDEAKDLKY